MTLTIHANSYLSDFQIFLQVRVVECQGREIGSINAVFVALGDFFFTPVRYFFHGRDVQIIFIPSSDNISPNSLTVAHVASYHDEPNHCSRLSPSLISSEKSCLRTAIFIFLLIPGLIFGVIFKGLPYLFKYNNMGEEISLLKMHFTMKNLCFGSTEDLVPRDTVLNLVEQGQTQDLGSKIHTLVIHSSDNFKLSDFRDRTSSIGALNPKIVVLVGGRVVDDGNKFLTDIYRSYFVDFHFVENCTGLSPKNKISAFNIEEFMRDNNITIPIRVESNRPVHAILELANGQK